MAGLEDLTTDQLLARARELESQATLFNSLISNPETRESIQRAVKKVNPKLVIPEIDARDAVRAEIETERQERLKLERRIQEDEIRRRLEAQRAGVMSEFRLTDADMLEVEKLMVDKDNPIPTYNAAARVYLASRQPATPTPASFSPPTYSMPEKDVWGKGIGNRAALDKIAMNEAFGAWNEIMSGKVAGMGPSRG